MDIVIGLILGAGCVLVWTWIVSPAPARRKRISRVRVLLDRAELFGVGAGVFVAASAACAGVVALAAFAFTRTLVLAILAGMGAGMVPVWAALTRARRLAQRRAHQWPAVIDDLVSGVRAGLALDETLSQLADRGPEALRPHLQAFRADLRATGRMSVALDALKFRLADPVGDRVVEALRCAHEVGGPDLGVVLKELAQMLRVDQRTRGELQARQSWTINGAKLAAAAPWIVLGVLCLQPEGAAAYRTTTGAFVLIGGALVSVVAYHLMLRLGRLPSSPRTFASRSRRSS